MYVKALHRFIQDLGKHVKWSVLQLLLTALGTLEVCMSPGCNFRCNVMKVPFGSCT